MWTEFSLIHKLNPHRKAEPGDEVVPPHTCPPTIFGVPLHIVTAVVEVELLMGKISKVVLNLYLVCSQLQDLEHCNKTQ